VFFILVMGAIELGRGLMTQHLLTNAARKACRVGVLSGRSTQQITTVATQTLSAQGISGDIATVQVNDGSTDASTAKSGDEITVIVTVPATQITWVPVPQSLLGNITGRYTLRRE
jgi:Flp pilus assembly protein TadG